MYHKAVLQGGAHWTDRTAAQSALYLPGLKAGASRALGEGVELATVGYVMEDVQNPYGLAGRDGQAGQAARDVIRAHKISL